MEAYNINLEEYAEFYEWSYYLLNANIAIYKNNYYGRLIVKYLN